MSLDPSPEDDVAFISRRLRMVDEQIASRGVKDTAVLAAMRTVPRHRFVSSELAADAYSDGPLSIGEGQTISQPYIVASMTELLEIDSHSRVLEIGTGSGYQTAVLAEIAGIVYSVERIGRLLVLASEILEKLKYDNVTTQLNDGCDGWPENAPYDAIIVTAAARTVPPALIEQLKIGGRLVIPLTLENGGRQTLYKIVRKDDGIERDALYDVRFVPLIED